MCLCHIACLAVSRSLFVFGPETPEAAAMKISAYDNLAAVEYNYMFVYAVMQVHAVIHVPYTARVLCER